MLPLVFLFLDLTLLPAQPLWSWPHAERYVREQQTAKNDKRSHTTDCLEGNATTPIGIGWPRAGVKEGQNRKTCGNQKYQST
jgi:hypothetical protein